MPISQYSIMEPKALIQCPLSTCESADSIDEELFDEICKRALISNDVLAETLRHGFEAILSLDSFSTVRELNALFANLAYGDDDYFDDRWSEACSIATRLDAVLYYSRDMVRAVAESYSRKVARKLSENKLSEDGLYDFLIGHLGLTKGFVRTAKALRGVYGYVLSENPDATVSDLANFVCSELAVGMTLETDDGEVTINDEILSALPRRFACFVENSDRRDSCEGKSETGDAANALAPTTRDEHGDDVSLPIPSYVLDAVRGRCFFDAPDDDVSVASDEISYTPSIAPSYVRALVISDTNALETDRIVEMSEDIARHAGVRWEVSIKYASDIREFLGTCLFNAQLILLIPNTSEDIERVADMLRTCELPAFYRGGGIVLGVCDDDRETVRFLLSDGGVPALDKSAQEIVESVPAAIIPSFYQLSFFPAVTDNGGDNEQVVQDIIHRLMLEYNQVKYSDSFLDTFLDVQGFCQSVGVLISSRTTHGDKHKKKAFSAFFDRWLSDCEYTLPQLLADVRGYGAKRNNDEAERLVVSIDNMRNDMNIASNEIRCLSYNSIERLLAMGIDERMLSVMEHKLDTLDGIISEMRTAIEDTRGKIS